MTARHLPLLPMRNLFKHLQAFVNLCVYPGTHTHRRIKRALCQIKENPRSTITQIFPHNPESFCHLTCSSMKYIEGDSHIRILFFRLNPYLKKKKKTSSESSG